jgi:membrane protease YdiL (CAAX protease family)
MEDNLPPQPDDDDARRQVTVIFAVFFELALAPISLILGWWFGHNPLETFRWSLGAALWGAGATIPLMLLSLAMLRWPIGPGAAFKEFCDNEVVARLENSSLSELALIALAVSVSDEMLCRGVLQAVLSDWFGVPGGLGLASVLFGLLQPISIPYMVMAGLLGLYLGTVWILGGNLLTVMVTHGLYEFAALTYLIRVRRPGGIGSASP